MVRCANIESYPKRKVDEIDDGDNDEPQPQQQPPKKKKNEVEQTEVEEEAEGAAEEEEDEEPNLRETPIEPNELMLELEKAADEYEANLARKTTSKTKVPKSADSKNKFDYVMALFEETFTRDELCNGTIPDAKNKTRSKIRVPFDDAKLYSIKKRLQDKYKLDEDYLEELWSNMRPDLNTRITRRFKNKTVVVVSKTLFGAKKSTKQD